MYAKPMPEAADLMGALLCTDVKTEAARSFFERLDRDQTAISAVRDAWDALPEHLFDGEATAKAVFHDAACNEGLFRLLALSYGDQAKVSVFLLEALKNRSIRSLKNHRDVVQQWCAPIRVAGTDTPVIESEYDDDYQEATETPHHLTAEVSSSSHSAVQVFISYARADEQKVKEIYRGLFEQNFKPWMDTADILPGENWEFAIQTAIRQSRFFIACLSKDSVDRRGFIQTEMREALDIWQEQQALDICLIPVRLDDCVVPQGLSRFHRADLFAEDGWIRLMDAIREDIRRRQAKE